MTTDAASLPADVPPLPQELERSTRGFWSLIVTQFQGAYSDNILRNLLLSMIVGMGMAKGQRESFVSMVTLMFSIPFVIFSMPGGWLADRFSKRQITIWTKVMEIGSMVVATAGLAAHSLTISLVALTLVATQAALFGPSKYGLLPERVALAFEDTFGIRPLEGYGCTECSPVVTVNGRDFRAPGFRQVGGRRGKIGHPLPGVSVKVVDLDTGEPVPPGTAGMLLVKGPNVMKGYLGKPEKTAEVLHDGWYTTGDVAMMEEDGFLTITDRLSRFSKIGGEMVPHIKIEDKLHEMAGVTEQVFAVSSLPDEKKGERIVVITTLANERLARVLEKLPQCDLPSLWKPRANQFFHVDALPVLGTGKIDLRGVKALAAGFSQAETE